MNQKSTGIKLGLKLLTLAILAVGGVVLFSFLRSPVGHAATGINQSLNFQGRLLDNTGAVVPDGSYNMEFKIYQDGAGCVSGGSSPCGGAIKWTEDWIQTNRVTVKNGYFSVNLGSLTAFGSNINWNQDTLWLSTNIGGTTNTPTPTWDGEMIPFKRLASSPYSLNSNALQGLQASNFVQLAQGVQSDSSTSNPSIFINKTNSSGTPNIVELQKSNTDVFVLDNNGSVISKNSSNSGSAFQVQDSSGTDILNIDTTNEVVGVSAFKVGIPSFPTTSVLDNFNRSNTGPPPSSSWSQGPFDFTGGQGLQVVTNSLKAVQIASFLRQDDYWNPTTFGPDSEAYVTVSTAVSTGEQIALYLRGNSITAGNATGYYLNVTESNVAGNWSLQKMTAGATSTIISLTQNISSGDSIGFSARGSTLLAWYKPSGGSWTLLGSTADSTYSSSGSIGVGIASTAGGNAATVLDDFGGGTTSNSGTSTSFSVDSNGTVLSKNISNSTSAFQVQNSSAAGIIEIGTTGTNSTSTINMVGNPSFESNIDGWSKLNGGETTFAYDDTAGNSEAGGSTLKVVTAAATTNGAQYAVPLANGTNYTFSIWAKTGSGSVTATLGRTENGSNAEGGCAAFTITTAWTQFSCSFTTANAGTAIYLRQTAAAINTIYLDGATLVQGSIGLSYDAGGSALTIQPQTNTLTLNGGMSAEIQPWQLNANALPNTRRYATTATGDGFIYYIGGTASNGASGAISTEADFAKLNSDGSVGSFSSLSASLPTATYGMAGSVYNGFLYLAGGCTAEGAFNANCSTASSTVYYAQIAPNGTLGKIFASTNSLPAARGYGAMVATNGYLFYLGGFTAAAAQNTVYTAKINADGTTGPWTAASNNLNTAVYGESATSVDGNIVLVGGCTSTNGTCTTQTTVVQYTTPTNSGNDSAFSTTGMTALGTATGFQGSALLNGNLYIIGGKQGSSVVSTVQYSQFTLNGSVQASGVWATSNYSLPLARDGAATLVNNGYIYALGGDNSAPQSTVYYTGGARVLAYGSLDLLGLTNQTQSDPGGGGTLNVGDTKIVGNLRVDNMTTLNNGLMVNGGPLSIANNSSLNSILNISNAVSTTAAQNESLLQVRDTTVAGNYNFGGLSISGGFLSQQTYFGEEFSAFKASSTVTLATTAAGTAGARGDSGDLSIDAVAGNSATGGTDTWTSNAANGYDEINCTSNNANRSVGCLMTNNNGTAGQQYAMFNTGNMPQLAVKFRAGNGVAPSSSGFYYVGLSNQAAAVTTGSANSYTSAIKGVYFSNCTTPGNGTGAVSGCGNTWFGVVNDGATVPAAPSTNEVACPATDAQGDGPNATGANFMFGRIEFRKDTSATSVQIEYFIDYNVNDGIKETSCGTVTATGAIMGNTAVGAFLDAHASGATGAAKLDVDYFRLYEDDNIPAQIPQQVQQSDNTTDSKSSDSINPASSPGNNSTLPLTNLDTSIDGINSLIDFTAATSEDTVFNNDVYVKGTIYANKIVANQIQGMDVITDEINSLSNQLAQAKAARPTTTTVSGSSPNPAAGVSLANGNTSGLLNLKTVQAVNLTVLTQLYAKGGFTVDGGSVFNGATQFKGQVSFNSDAGGTAIIKKGASKVQIKFSSAYKTSPIITANYLFNSGDASDDQANQQDLITNNYSFVVTQITAKGFTIILNQPADHDINFSWLATQIDNPQTTQSQDVSTSGN